MSNESLRLSIDSTQAEAGAARFAAAIRRIEGAISRLDRSSASLERVQRIAAAGGFAKLAQDAAAFAAIRINSANVRAIERLGAALSGFKGVNPRTLRSVGDLFLAVTGIQRVAPTSLAGLSALSGFRGPSPAAVRNLQAFGVALQSLQPPRNAAAIIATLNAIGNAAGNLRGINSGLRSLAFLQNGAIRAGAAVRGLGGSFGFASQAASLFSPVLAALGLSAFISQMQTATAAVISFENALKAVADEGEIAGFLDFVSRSSDRLGTSLTTNLEEFPRLATAMMLTGRSAAEVQRLYEVLSGSMRVLNLDANRQRLVWMAFNQMFSVNQVRAEEVRRQLADHLPGAVQIFSRAYERATGDIGGFDKAMREGRINANLAMFVVEELAQMYGGQLTDAMRKSTAQQQRLSNAWTQFLIRVGQSGDAGLAEAFRRITEVMQSPEFAAFADRLGRDIGRAAMAIGDGFAWAVRNGELLANVFKAFLALSAVRFFTGLAGGVVSFARGLTPLLTMLPRVIAFLRFIPQLRIPLALAAIGSAAITAGGDMESGINRGVTNMDRLRGVVDEFASNVRNLGSDIANAFRDGFAAVRPYAEPVLNWLRDRFRDLGNWIAESFDRGLQTLNPVLHAQLNQFLRNADARARAHRDTRERGLLRGRTAVDDAGFVTPPTDLTSLNIFRTPSGDSGRSRARQNETWVAQLSPAASLTMEYEEATRMLAQAQAQLRAAGIDAATAQRLLGDRLRESFDLMTQTDSALRALAQRREVLAEAERRGLIDGERRQRLERDAVESMREGLSLYSDSEGALLSYQRRQRDLAEALAAMPELHNAVSAALERNKFEFLENAGALTQSERAARAYALALERAAAVESAGASGDFLRRSAGRDFASSLVGDVDRPFAERQRDLEALAASGAISAQQYRDALAQMTASTLEFRAAMSGSFADSFLAEMARIQAGVTSAGAVLGRTLAQVSNQGITSLSEGLAKVITQGESLRDVLYGVVNQALNSLLAALIEVGIRMLINAAIGQAAQATAAATSAATAATVAASWAPAAAMASLASFGGNAAPAMAGLAATSAMAQALASIPAFADGGLVGGSGGPRSDNQLARVSPGEVIINAQSAAANMSLLNQVNNSGGRSVAANDVTVQEGDVHVTNVYSPDAMVGALKSVAGRREILNIIGDNSDKIRHMLSR